MKDRYPRTFPPDEASSWRRIRKYAVPRSMIEQATERRLAGDWRGACAAANVDVEFDRIDPARLRGAETIAWLYGKETVARLEEDLRYLAPDLVRWHLPRCLHGHTTLRPGRCVILASYGGKPANGPYLYITTQKMVDGPQRLTLCLGGIDDKQYSWQYAQVQDWRLARHLWDTRQAHKLLDRCGGGTRAPFRNADGTPRAADELPTQEPSPDDPVGRAEWITSLFDHGNTKQAFEAAGITLDLNPPRVRFYSPPPLRDALASHPFALTRLEPEIRLLDASGFGRRYQIPYGAGAIVFELRPRRMFGRGLIHIGPADGGLCVRMGAKDDVRGIPSLPEAFWRRLPDLDLLRFGDIAPEGLHPLVSASLFPERAKQPADGPPDPAAQSFAPVRVRCRGEWHEVRSLNGRLSIPHTEEEERREQAIRAFGGPVTGCFATAQAWTSGVGWLPKALREQRREFFSHVQHGDTAEVLRLLDVAIDPHIRDGRRRTLLHLLHLLDYQAVLPRLLTAGLDLEARDHHQRTPLHVAVGEGPAPLVHALLDAGARTDVVDHENQSLLYPIYQHRRKELRFLIDLVKRDHPDLAKTDYLPWWGDLDD